MSGVKLLLCVPLACGARVFGARGAPYVSMTGRVRIKNTVNEESHLRIPPTPERPPYHVIDLEQIHPTRANDIKCRKK